MSRVLLQIFLFSLTLLGGCLGYATLAHGAEPSRTNHLPNTSNPLNADSVLSKYGHLTPEQLLDTARYYDLKRQYDTSLICYGLIINSPETDDSDAARLKPKIDALIYSAVDYYWMSDYVKAYQLLSDALDLCETRSHKETELIIQANIGNIYYQLDEYDMAVQYYTKALELCTDSTGIMLAHNNIAAVKMEAGDLAGASSHIEKSLRISERNNSNLYIVMHTAASVYQKKGDFHSAFRYFQSALDDARKNGSIEYEAEILSGMGNLSFETGRLEDAAAYIASSSAIAKEHNLNNILLDNHRLLSKMERTRGRYRRALEHLEQYNILKDSLFSADKLMSINQLQRINEISKTNRRIETLTVEQQIKERTISFQKIILFVALAVLLLVAAVLLIVFRQKRKLNKAYRTLFEKNLEIMELQDGPLREQYHYNSDGELLGRILAIMENTEIICNPKFSINMLSLLADSNHTYVSQVINTAMNKNFRSFLNSYRIREAQRLFSEPDAAKYTLESVSLQLGYKSQNTFRTAFQEITGVSPSFYVKSMCETPKD